MKTAALAAFIQGRNMRFAGAPVTLAKILQMWQLPHDGGETIDGPTLDGVARYCKLSVAELTTAVEAMQPAAPAPRPAPLPSPPPAPTPLATFATVQIPPVVAQNPPAPEPPPVVIETTKPVPDPTAVMPQDQLSDLVAASRKSSPVIASPAPLAGPEDDDEVEISFDEVEATPIPETPEAASAAVPTSDASAVKSKKKRKKKS